MYTHRQGFSLVEIIVASAIFIGAVVVLVGALSAFSDLSRHTAERTQAALLLEEGAEAVQLLRDHGWEENIAALTLEASYSLYWDGSAYQATTTDVAIDGTYYRTMVVHPVYRDASDSVAESGTEDSNTRRVTLQIERASDGEVLLSSDMLIHNAYEE